jgi:hypothetical protein
MANIYLLAEVCMEDFKRPGCWFVWLERFRR